jgi:hypothetical protein
MTSEVDRAQGWYRDPAGRVRFWNSAWTVWVLDKHGRTQRSALPTEVWLPPSGDVVGDDEPWRIESLSHRRSVISITISIATLVVFIDFFAPLTWWFSLGFALAALRAAATHKDRRLAWIALAVSMVPLVAFLLLAPMYSSLNGL